MGDLVKLSQFSAIVSTLEALDRCGVTTDDLKLIRTDKDLSQRIADVIHAEKGMGYKIDDMIHNQTGEFFIITVQSNLTWKQRIEAGHYDSVRAHDLVSDNFPFEKGNDEVKLEARIRLGPPCRSQVRPWFEERGFRLATFAELLAFGATYPQRQMAVPILTLYSFDQDAGNFRKGTECTLLLSYLTQDCRTLSLNFLVLSSMFLNYYLVIRK